MTPEPPPAAASVVQRTVTTVTNVTLPATTGAVTSMATHPAAGALIGLGVWILERGAESLRDRRAICYDVIEVQPDEP